MENIKTDNLQSLRNRQPSVSPQNGFSKQKRNKLLCIALGAALLVGSFGASYSWLTFANSKTSEMISGAVSTKIVQEFTQPKVLTPGLSFQDNPQVSNTGNLPCFVRASVNFSNSIGQSECEDLSINSDWKYNANDGHYYYSKVLHPGETTPALFDHVKVKTTANPDDLQNLDIDVSEEAIQQGDLAESSYQTSFNM